MVNAKQDAFFTGRVIKLQQFSCCLANACRIWREFLKWHSNEANQPTPRTAGKSAEKSFLEK
jgi:hypothetical protein